MCHSMLLAEPPMPGQWPTPGTPAPDGGGSSTGGGGGVCVHPLCTEGAPPCSGGQSPPRGVAMPRPWSRLNRAGGRAPAGARKAALGLPALGAPPCRGNLPLVTSQGSHPAPSRCMIGRAAFAHRSLCDWVESAPQPRPCLSSLISYWLPSCHSRPARDPSASAASSLSPLLPHCNLTAAPPSPYCTPTRSHCDFTAPRCTVTAPHAPRCTLSLTTPVPGTACHCLPLHLQCHPMHPQSANRRAPHCRPHPRAPLTALYLQPGTCPLSMQGNSLPHSPGTPRARGMDAMVPQGWREEAAASGGEHGRMMGSSVG